MAREGLTAVGNRRWLGTGHSFCSDSSLLCVPLGHVKWVGNRTSVPSAVSTPAPGTDFTPCSVSRLCGVQRGDFTVRKRHPLYRLSPTHHLQGPTCTSRRGQDTQDTNSSIPGRASTPPGAQGGFLPSPRAVLGGLGAQSGDMGSSDREAGTGSGTEYSCGPVVVPAFSPEKGTGIAGDCSRKQETGNLMKCLQHLCLVETL